MYVQCYDCTGVDWVGQDAPSGLFVGISVYLRFVFVYSCLCICVYVQCYDCMGVDWVGQDAQSGLFVGISVY